MATLVLVPGIGGSELRTQPLLFGLGSRELLWLSVSGLLAGGWRLLGLQADGVTPSVPLTGPLVPGYPLPAYYSIIANGFFRFGWKVVSPKLDWRQDIARDAGRLADLIRSHSADAPLVIVAHSRGGLVTRAALGLLSQSGELGLVSRVACLGTPHWGSWQAQGSLAGWNTTAARIGLLLALVNIAAPVTRLLGNFQSVMATWPAVYQLLPHPNAPGLPADVSTRLYSSSAWSSVGVPVSDAWLQQAKATWLSLPAVPAGVSWLNVVGNGFPTATEVIGSSLPTRESDLIWPVFGDGTVPASWGQLPGVPTWIVPDDHGALVQDGRLVPLLNTYLRGGSATDQEFNWSPLA